jgi:CheY-like chemotaxis protein
MRPGDAPPLALVIDDDLGAGGVAGKLLQRFGYRIAIVPDGHLGLAFVERDGAMLALVVTDINMPGISGNDVAAVLRYYRPDLPVVACTGDRASLALPPAVPALIKPFTSDELRAAIVRAQAMVALAPEPDGAADGWMALARAGALCEAAVALQRSR